jgi:hypothetical protein
MDGEGRTKYLTLAPANDGGWEHKKMIIICFPGTKKVSATVLCQIHNQVSFRAGLIIIDPNSYVFGILQGIVLSSPSLARMFSIYEYSLGKIIIIANVVPEISFRVTMNVIVNE